MPVLTQEKSQRKTAFGIGVFIVAFWSAILTWAGTRDRSPELALMRIFVKLWLTLLPAYLVGSPTRSRKKRYPPLREVFVEEPATRRELKRGF